MKKGYRVIAPDRYLRCEPVDGEVEVQHDGKRIAHSARAERLHEGDRDAAIYVPVDDIDGAQLVPSDTVYHCRWKGDAAYADVVLDDGTRLADGAWRYDTPPDDLAAIAGHVSFDPARFSVEVSQRGDGA